MAQKQMMGWPGVGHGMAGTEETGGQTGGLEAAKADDADSPFTQGRGDSGDGFGGMNGGVPYDCLPG